MIRADLRGTNLGLVRQRNLSIVLTRVHELESISRAQLTKDTGLNRSTIADLTTELVQLGLVSETEPDPTNLVGRPSAVLVPSDRVVALTVHPELDAVTIAAVALGGRVLRRRVAPTTSIPTVDEVITIASAEVAAVTADLGAGYRVAGVGVAIPGLVRASDGIVTLAPHLDWHYESIGERLAAATGYPVAAGNDASLGALAEHTRGAGRGVRDLVYISGGASGIGGGIISGGSLLGGLSGYAGEFGHTMVNSSGITCHCGSTGCLETEVTRAALLDVLALTTPQAASLEEVLAARVAEPAVAALLERQSGYLARAIANAVNVFNPRLVVLGGFLGSLYTAAGHDLLERVRSLALEGPRDEVEIVAATLGRDGLAVGAAELAFRGLLRDPAGTAS
jgi:predicted NBD/HSP70 family sugar kinase